MKMLVTRRLCGVLVIAAAFCATAAFAQDLDATLREEVVMVPSTGFTESELEVTLYRPPGDGPFPVMVINHGRALGNARMQPRARYPVAAREFVSRGYLVAVPMRQGFSRSGGNEISGGCNVQSNGVQQAKSVRRTLDWLGQQPFADVSRNVVMGQSHGGLTTLAYGTDPHPGTKLLVNFAGGLRQEGCTGWQSNMTRGIGSYGETTKLPSLWFTATTTATSRPRFGGRLTSAIKKPVVARIWWRLASSAMTRTHCSGRDRACPFGSPKCWRPCHKSACRHACCTT
jgi:dienelactone hydrolase